MTYPHTPLPPSAPPPWPGGPCAAPADAPTPETLGIGDDLIAQALHALGQFGPLTRSKAERLLSMWTRRDELTDQQRAEVLAYYPTGDAR